VRYNTRPHRGRPEAGQGMRSRLRDGSYQRSDAVRHRDRYDEPIREYRPQLQRPPGHDFTVDSMSAIGSTRLSLSLEAVIFGAIALNLIYLVFFGSIWIIAMMILFFSYESTLSDGTLWIFAASLASIVGVYKVGMWAVRGFLEMRRLPIYAATSILLLFSGESIFVACLSG
jgi:hypothetical protein